MLNNLVVPNLTDEELMQMQVLVEAFRLYQVRDRKYKGLWKEGGYNDSAHHVRHKAARVAMCLRGDQNEDGHYSSGDDVSDLLEDALDLINYSAFFIRNVRLAEAVKILSAPIKIEVDPNL